MPIKNIIREPFGYADVARIVCTEKESGNEGLKERVTRRVRDITGIEGEFPERIKSWIHQFCMSITAEAPVPKFSGKVSRPIDLASLPNRTK